MSSSSPDFSELKVVAFESRMSKETAHLIRRYGGTPLVAPSMREIPLGDHSAVESFAKHLLDKTLDTVVFLTGVGARLLLNSSFELYTKEQILNAIAETTIITRGPKPAAVIRDSHRFSGTRTKYLARITSSARNSAHTRWLSPCTSRIWNT